MGKCILELCLLLMVLPAAQVHAETPAALMQRYQVLEQSLQKLRSDYAATLARIESFEGRVIDNATVCEGRLTLESGVPLSTTDQSNMTNLFFTPYKGNNVSLYNGSTWVVNTFTERSLALAALSANTNYDVFLYDNSGTLTLELTAWSTDTARATALVAQDGVWVRSGATTRRYLGTIRMTSATQTQDTASQRFVWNYQNRLRRRLEVIDTTNTWTYNADVWRSANGSAANRVEYVAGLDDVLLDARVLALITNGTGALNYYSAGVGIDSTTVNSAAIRGSGSSNLMVNQCWGDYKGYPGIGYHFVQWLERAHASTITVWGDNGAPTTFQSGLLGEIDG